MSIKTKFNIRNEKKLIFLKKQNKMNLLNNFRKPYFAIFLASLILLSSCKSDDSLSTTESQKFDYAFYQNNKGSLLNLNSINLINNSNPLMRSEPLTTLEKSNIILTEINTELGTDLDFDNDFKEIELDTYTSVENYIYKNNILEPSEMYLLNNFKNNLSNLELTDAINILEQEVHNANLDVLKVEQFEYFANTVMLLENDDPGIFTAKAASPCSDALLGLAFATVSLAGACSPPAMGASVGFFCYVAGANYIRASIAVGKACK